MSLRLAILFLLPACGASPTTWWERKPQPAAVSSPQTSCPTGQGWDTNAKSCKALLPIVPAVKANRAPLPPPAKTTEQEDDARACEPGYTFSDALGACESNLVKAAAACQGRGKHFDVKNKLCRNKRFSDFCRDPEDSYEINLTLSRVLNSLKVRECEEAESLVASRQTLDLSGFGQKITDVTPLAGLRGLVKLNLANHEIIDLGPLRNLKDLEVLILANNRIQDVRPLYSLRKLKRLDLSGNPVSDLKPLAKIPSLVRVTLSKPHEPLGFEPQFKLSFRASSGDAKTKL